MPNRITLHVRGTYMRDDVNIERDAMDNHEADGPNELGSARQLGDLEDAESGARNNDTASDAQADGVSARVDAPADIERSVSESRDKYLRLAAEFDNYRKRTTRERQEAGSRAQADLLKQLVTSLDDLARVTAMDPASTDSASVISGVDFVSKNLLKALTAAGLEVVNPVDQIFDPSFHEAVATEPALSREDDHLVSRVYQQGYRFNGQLLRPAKVVVRQWND